MRQLQPFQSLGSHTCVQASHKEPSLFVCTLHSYSPQVMGQRVHISTPQDPSPTATTATIEALLAHGASRSLGATDSNGCTPLHAAALLGRCDVAALLLARGAPAGVLDRYGRLALHCTAAAGGAGAAALCAALVRTVCTLYCIVVESSLYSARYMCTCLSLVACTAARLSAA
jgi:ankyrin repeat protein